MSIYIDKDKASANEDEREMIIEQESGLVRSFRYLSQRVESLDKGLAALQDRLRPIMRSSEADFDHEPKKEQAQIRSPLCSLAEDIYLQADKIEELRECISEINLRLDI